jgi:hypothetical protein
VRKIEEIQLPGTSLRHPELTNLNSEFKLEAFAIKEGREGVVFTR